MTALDRPIILVTAIAYLTVIVAIGVWATLRTRTAKDFFIAGQSVGLWVTGLATMSAAFSGFVFIGGPGLTYRMGIASLFICIPVGFTAAMLGWTVAVQLRQMAQEHEIYTVPDAILHRYQSRTASGLAAIAVVIGTVGYLGAQLLALGVLIEEIFGTDEFLGAWSQPVAMAAGLAVILVYAAAGGMLAGVYTDVVQGILMVVAAAGVFFYALASTGGPRAMARSIAENDAFGPAFLDPLGTVPPLTALGFFFVFGIGVLGQPHMLHKFYMLDDPKKLKWIPALLGGTQAVCVLLWLGIGLAVPALVAQGRIPPLDPPRRRRTHVPPPLHTRPAGRPGLRRHPRRHHVHRRFLRKHRSRRTRPRPAQGPAAPPPERTQSRPPSRRRTGSSRRRLRLALPRPRRPRGNLRLRNLRSCAGARRRGGAELEASHRGSGRGVHQRRDGTEPWAGVPRQADPLSGFAGAGVLGAWGVADGCVVGGVVWGVVSLDLGIWRCRKAGTGLILESSEG